MRGVVLYDAHTVTGPDFWLITISHVELRQCRWFQHLFFFTQSRSQARRAHLAVFGAWLTLQFSPQTKMQLVRLGTDSPLAIVAAFGGLGTDSALVADGAF